MSKKHHPPESPLGAIAAHNVAGRDYPCHGQFSCYFCGLESHMHEHINQLTGEILTAIDSAIVNDRQNKATKDVARKSIVAVTNSLHQDLRWMLANAMSDPEHNYKAAQLRPSSAASGLIGGV